MDGPEIKSFLEFRISQTEHNGICLKIFINSILGSNKKIVTSYKYLTITEWGLVLSEEDDTKAEFNNCFIIHSKWVCV